MKILLAFDLAGGATHGNMYGILHSAQGGVLTRIGVSPIFVAVLTLASVSALGQGTLSDKVKPKPSKDDVRGYDRIYGAVTIGGTGVEEAVGNPNPEEKKKVPTLGNAEYAANTEFLLGWGPVSFRDFSFFTHYRYAQIWWTDFPQLARFSSQWLGSPKAETFLFPTKAMVRTHEWASELRYSLPDPVWGVNLNAGVQTLLSIGRTGSALFGQQLETSDTVWKMENMAPYVSLRYGNQFRTQLVFPFRTYLDKVNPQASYATYSWSNAGRGKLFSVYSRNEIGLHDIRSYLYFDIRYYQLKYSALTLDRNRPGIALTFDFPVFQNLRIAAKGAYETERFFLPKVRIPSFQKGSRDETTDPAEEFTRSDARYSYGGTLYYDMGETRNHRFFVSYSSTSIVSTIEEYNGQKNTYSGGYQWSFPGAFQIARRTKRFSEETYAGEF